MLDAPPVDNRVLIGKMRHDCEQRGCFLNTLHPAKEVLAGYLPKTPAWQHIRPSDIDGVIEHKGYFLFIEFKSERASDVLQRGQLILLQQLSRLKNCKVIVVDGLLRPEDDCRRIAVVDDGPLKWEEQTRDQLGQRVTQWAEWVSQRPHADPRQPA